MNKILISMMFAWILLAVPIEGAIGGFTSVDIISNHKDLSGQVWLIKWTDTGYDTDSLAATLDPDDMYDLSNGEFTTEESFQLSVDATDDGCFYNIQKSTFPKVFTIDAILKEFWFTDRVARDEWIRDSCFNGRAYMQEGVIDKVWCYVVQDFLGTPGEIGSPQYEFETTWSMSSPGKPTLTEKVCSGVHSSSECSGIDVKVGDYAYVEWQGSLDTGTKCEDAKNEYAMHSNAFSDGWRVTEKSNYDDFRSYYYTLVTYEIDIVDWALGRKTESFIEDKANTIAHNAVNAKISGVFVSQWGDMIPDIEDSSITTGIIRWIATDDRLQFPTFNVYTDADYYLKVIKPCGEPDITGVTISTIDEGTREDARVSVKNIGDYSGGFFVKIKSCTDDFAPTSSGTGITLDAGSSTTVNLPITFTSTSQTESLITGTCIAEMKSVCPDEQTDTYTFTVQGKQMVECTPGHKKCAAEGEEVLRCNDAGLKYESYEICGENEYCEAGECLAEPLLCGDGICGIGEDWHNCPADCDKPGECGDGICDFGEQLSCPIDCLVDECITDIHCDDSLVCTIDTCVAGQCANTRIPGCQEPGVAPDNEWLMWLGVIALAISIVAFASYVYTQRKKRMQPKIPFMR